MNWRVIIRPNAEADLQEAWSWYEAQRTGLETAARELRWEWLRAEAASIDAALVATGPGSAAVMMGLGMAALLGRRVVK